MVPAATKTKADVEYQVMLAVLNFHRDYLALHYSRIRIQMIDNVIEVTLAPRRPIQAEQLLAQSPEGRVQLQQMHTAAFRSGEAQLRDRLQGILGQISPPTNPRLLTSPVMSSLNTEQRFITPDD